AHDAAQRRIRQSLVTDKVLRHFCRPSMRRRLIAEAHESMQTAVACCGGDNPLEPEGREEYLTGGNDNFMEIATVRAGLRMGPNEE
ncbi:MAG: hypothetical protein KJS68_12880, partial [Alphaproteobacteria bacterium]|nr:hypothetical protein [Alphaproteobacteria bacterium]